MNSFISSTALSHCCQERKIHLSFSFFAIFSAVLICEFPPPSVDDEPFHLTNHAGNHLSFSGLVFCLVNEFDQLTEKSSKWWECLKVREGEAAATSC